MLNKFLLTRPLRGATRSSENTSLFLRFLLTRPLRGATAGLMAQGYKLGISTHTPLAGRDPAFRLACIGLYISTHTPLAGRDLSSLTSLSMLLTISTHTPLAGRDRLRQTRRSRGKFLLTRPLRGATNASHPRLDYGEISTHTPLAGRDMTLRYPSARSRISTHTPLAGRDNLLAGHGRLTKISTHTPLAGRGARRDPNKWGSDLVNFYSHAPCGARRTSKRKTPTPCTFLLTRPLRGATLTIGHEKYWNSNFYSHAPCGARLPPFSFFSAN